MSGGNPRLTVSHRYQAATSPPFPASYPHHHIDISVILYLTGFRRSAKITVKTGENWSKHQGGGVRVTEGVGKVNFGQLLAATGETDLQELQSRKSTLEKKRVKLQAELAQVQKELQQVQAELNAPIRNAVKAAKLLGIEVPEEYKTTGSNNGGKSKGKYYWEAPGQVPFQAEISRAMWRLSPGSGGSAGKNGEGVLTVAEFWGLVGLTEEEVKVGAIHTVSLPNGKEVAFQRME